MNKDHKMRKLPIAMTAALATVLGSVLTAWAFYHGVDRPTIFLTRRFDAWLFRPRVDGGTLAVPSRPSVRDTRAA